MILTTALLWGLYGFFAGYAIGAIAEFVSSSTIQKTVRNDGALYAVIRKMQTDTVAFEEIDRYGNSEKKGLKSEKGISSDLYVGQKIYA